MQEALPPAAQFGKRQPQVEKYPAALLTTRFGVFRIVAFPGEHAALVKGEVAGKEGVLVRIHSECLTGDVFFSLKCDCREQLERALELIGEEGRGILVYLRQEGRGIGLVNKIRAYVLQEQGLDTVEADRRLGFEGDMRDYGVAAEILKHLGVGSIKLMTNNPEKVRSLEEHGVRVERIPLVVEPNGCNRDYLEAKRDKLGHAL